MKKLITVADWAHDSLNSQEFKIVVEGYLKEPINSSINFVASTPSTIHTSFLVAQITDIEERFGIPGETIIFQNTDPRLQATEGVEKAKGAEFLIVRLRSGIFVCGPNSGYDFTLIKNKIDELYHYSGLQEGSQFRSRDLYSRICAHLMDEMEDDLDLEEGPTDVIPELEGFHIVHIDNHGNIKTTLTSEYLKGKHEFGEMINISINGLTKKARYVSNLFGGTPGELVIYPGSSGQKENPYLEVTIWRHFTEKDISTGAAVFNNPRPGMEIKIL